MSRISRSKASDDVINVRGNRIIEDVVKQNISNGGFFIQKAEIDIVSMGGSEKLLGIIKYNSAGEYSISIRSRAGIEAARIFLSKDTILINDKINRTVLYGSAGDLKNKYGITTSIIPVIFGDFIDNKLVENRDVDCVDDSVNVEVIIEGITLGYIIDCRRRKTAVVVGEARMRGEGLEMKYSSYFKRSGKLIPGKIEIKDMRRETTIIINIVKMEIPWDGLIDFIPGNRYDKIQLQ